MTWILMAAVLATAQVEPKAKVAARVDGVPEAISGALRDATQLSVTKSPLLPVSRYVWIHTGKAEHAAAVVLMMNQVISRSALPVRAAVIPLPGGSLLLRFNFLLLAFDRKRLAEILDVWELLAVDEPFFLLAKGNIFASEKDVKKRKALHEACRAKKILAEDLAPWAIGLDFLQAVTGSRVPIVRGDWLLQLLTSTIDQGYGKGLYYEFRGIKNLSFDEFLALAGADRKKAAATNTDISVLLTKSKVTGRQRKITVVPASKIGKGRGYGAAWWTEDGSEDQVKDRNSPFRNPLGHEFAAIEAFIEAPNGLVISGLFAADGTQQDAAPDNVVHDHYAGKGTGGTRRLQGGIISCGRCHMTESKSWYQPAPNHFKLLLKKGGVDIVDDVSLAKLGLGRQQAIERLVSVYDVELDRKVLPDARGYYQDAVVKIVGDVWAKQADYEAWKVITSLYNDYAYGQVTTAGALFELGVAIPDAKLASAAFVSQFRARPGFVADPFVGLLVAGQPICRADFDRIFPVLVGVDVVALAKLQGAALGGTPKRTRPRTPGAAVPLPGPLLMTTVTVLGPVGREVWVQIVGETRWRRSGYTDSRGRLVLENLAPSGKRYSLDVWLNGATRRIRIEAGRSQQVRF